MTEDQHRQQDPKQKYPQPEYPEQTQMDQHPGLESEMDPRPDYGEETYQGHGRLEGKKAVITGGDSGIGRAVALAFAREGADVLISYLEDEESDAAETARVVEDSGKACVKVPGDISDESQCQAIIQKAVDEFGGIDVLVNNAAHQMTVDSIADVSTELLDRTFKTNIYAMFWLVKAALPHMREGGSIINVGSAQAYKPSPGSAPLRRDQGRHHHLHRGPGAGGHPVRTAGQRRRAWARVDPDHPRLHARRDGLQVSACNPPRDARASP